MKKLLALLICVLLLCAPVFSASAAPETFEYTFTAPNMQYIDAYTDECDFCTFSIVDLEIWAKTEAISPSFGFWLAWADRTKTQIKAKDGYMIDEVEFTVTRLDTYGTLYCTPGNPSSVALSSLSTGSVVDIKEINSAEFNITSSSDPYINTKSVTVKGHKLPDPPLTGDSTNMPMLIAALAVSGVALVGVASRKRREY